MLFSFDEVMYKGGLFFAINSILLTYSLDRSSNILRHVS
jgi:hypothetical protein